ncbi:NEW3 domain-containing protein [Bacillus testis]|uniref:NEW3 domain-containing protein n=1 Tax=Bacillus testis TaxID=1622072 RepID=UPI00067EEE63|nr:NEW3 domain-containing protein [Bacillus testis]
MKKALIFFLAFLLMAYAIPPFVKAEKNEIDEVALWNAVKPLETTVTFLNTGAHPDDERSDLLAYLSRGLGVKTASLIANRGEGGQNEIGKELGNGLGIIRTYEMKAAAKVTGVKAYHLSQTTSDPIYDFGFSKTPEETLAKWGEQLTYERLIRFIRTYKPDIVMPSFRNDRTQHGHHRTMTILSERAFKDAADPAVFPEQLREGLTTWQIKKLYLSAESKETATTSLEIGMVDPVYQMTYPQLGEESRFLHKSQGMGSKIPAEPRKVYLELAKSVQQTPSDSLFKGIPYNLAEWAGRLPSSQPKLKVALQNVQKRLDRIVDAYPHTTKIAKESHTAMKEINAILKQIKSAKLDADLKVNLENKLAIKLDQLSEASYEAANLDITVHFDSDMANRGSTRKAEVKLVNNGKENLKETKVALKVPQGWKQPKEISVKALKPGESFQTTVSVGIPKDAAYYHPYQEPAVSAEVAYTLNGIQNIHNHQLEGTFAVLPEVSVEMSPESTMLNTQALGQPISVQVNVKNYAEKGGQAAVSLNTPQGWKSEPGIQNVSFNGKLKEKQLTFKVTPPDTVKEGTVNVSAQAKMDGKLFTTNIQEINYDHIGKLYQLKDSSLKISAFPLTVPKGLKVGYIDSGFDTVADSLKEAGFTIEKISESELPTADLAQYDSIIVGIRAYLSRKDLVANNKRLLDYVKNGGHVVMQYHKPGDAWDENASAPYRLKIGNPSIEYRVTDEQAKVTMLHPESQLFNYPNAITEKDWDGWIQERGLYFPMAWDSHYETMVRMGDPGEEPFDSGILKADYGKGTYIYTSLVFYRQIQDQVPGAYRIFANLISYGTNGK